MFVGGLEKWKGVETVCKAATVLGKDNILVAIIGGTAEEIKGLRASYPEVLFLGAHPYRELAQNQQAADVLVVPNSAREEISRSFTSPLKLFAHMASGVALAVADVPALKEVVAPTQAFQFISDDPRDLARAVKQALSPAFLSERLSKAREAEKRVHDFTWGKRAKRIVEFLRS
jgi:glycosyltransferase involved in cell wall biosynthesis